MFNYSIVVDLLFKILLVYLTCPFPPLKNQIGVGVIGILIPAIAHS
jgi:hypothetical protein